MPTITSFHSSEVEPDQLSAIMADYLALERARIYRRLFVTRFGLLAFFLAVIGVGFHWLSAFGSWFGVGLCLAAPTWAWIVELECGRRLSRRLEEVPGGVTLVAPSAPDTKVIKSS